MEIMYIFEEIFLEAYAGPVTVKEMPESRLCIKIT
jgi:hypothetical protein